MCQVVATALSIASYHDYVHNSLKGSGGDCLECQRIHCNDGLYPKGWQKCVTLKKHCSKTLVTCTWTCIFCPSSSAVLQTYLTINTRTRPDCRPCCSPQIWWESCIPCTVFSCMVSCQRWLPQDKNSMTPESFRWLCRGFVSSTVLPCWTCRPFRYSEYI